MSGNGTLYHTVGDKMTLVIDHSGRKFGRLKAIKCVGRDKHRRAKWKCECECGNMVVVSSVSLVTGNTNSCGCLLRDKIVTHGMSGGSGGK